MKITEVSRQDAGEAADALDLLMKKPSGVNPIFTPTQWTLLIGVAEALHDAERMPKPVVPSFGAYADGVD